MAHIDPVARPGGWPSDLPPRSALFGCTPYGFNGETREDLGSYFRRLCEEHGMLPWSIAWCAVAPLTNVSSKDAARNVADECYEQAICGVTKLAARWADALNRLTLRSDLQLLTLLPLRGLVSQYKLISSASRFCGFCYAEDEKSGRQKYNRLIWSFDCVGACPCHEFELVSEHPSSKTRPLSFTVPGISRFDGRSLAGYRQKKASAYDVQIARLVAELLDDAVHFPEALRETSALPAFLAHAANELFDGKSARLARHLGVGKSQLHGWMHKNVHPSLSRAAHIAYCCGCTIADVFLGNKVMLSAHAAPAGGPKSITKKRRTGFKKSIDELLEELAIFMATHETASAKDAADELGISIKYLRKIASQQYETLVDQGKWHRFQEAQSKRDAKDQAYYSSHLAIAGSGRYPARRLVIEHVQEVTGLKFRFGETTRAQRKAHAASKIQIRGPAW